MIFHMFRTGFLLIPLLFITILPVFADFHEEMVEFMPDPNRFDENWELTQIQGFENLELDWSSETPNGLIQRLTFYDNTDQTTMTNTVSVYDFSTQTISSNIFEDYISKLIEYNYPIAPLDESLQNDCFATMINVGEDNERTSVACQTSKYVIIATSEQSGKVFFQGQQYTTANLANGLAQILYENIVNYKPTTNEIPDWIKNNAGWWADGITNDNTFVNAIQFLINEKIIVISNTPESIQDNPSNEIPAWIKNNAKWWSTGQISDDDFVTGIQYLIEKGIIQIN